MKHVLIATLVVMISACNSESGVKSDTLDVVLNDDGKNLAPARELVTRGNGDKNWIITEGLTQNGAKLTVPEVKIDGPGWLVLHPFEDGKPNGLIYSAATYLEDGINENVELEFKEAPESGTPFVIMLHADYNNNAEFDFVFIDESNVVDRAKFEGNKMIANIIKTP